MIGSRVGRTLATRIGASSSASSTSAASSVSRRNMSDHHGPTDNWPKSPEEMRRLWGYGLATLGVFLYASYKIRGPGEKKATTTTTTTQTVRH